MSELKGVIYTGKDSNGMEVVRVHPDLLPIIEEAIADTAIRRMERLQHLCVWQRQMLTRASELLDGSDEYSVRSWMVALEKGPE